MQDQDEFITRDTNFEDVALVANDRANLEDVGCNADPLTCYSVISPITKTLPKGLIRSPRRYAPASIHECA